MNKKDAVVVQLTSILKGLKDIPSFTSWCVGVHASDCTDFISFIDELRAIQGVTDDDLIENFRSYLIDALEIYSHENLPSEWEELNIKVASALIYTIRPRTY
jgi:hypothetical protein